MQTHTHTKVDTDTQTRAFVYRDSHRHTQELGESV